MKKIFLSFSLCILTIIASAAGLTSTTGKLYTNYLGVDYIFIFNGIDNSSEIVYDSIETNIKWYAFNDLTPMSTGAKLFGNIESGNGYILEEENGKRITFWVIDYKNYLPVFTLIEAENKPNEQCEELNLLLDATIPPLTYQSLAGETYTLPRDFKLSYETYEWKETTWQIRKVDSTLTFNGSTLPQIKIAVPSPFRNTDFTITGDQYAQILGIKADSITSTNYITSALLPLKSITTIRLERNEAERPSQASIDGSAPLDIQFIGSANESSAIFFKWEIYKENRLLISRTDKDHRYTFSEAGKYKVKLTSSNNYCSKSDSITITVSESKLEVPNVFTPNGDEINDEFRVAFKSIVKFDCWVYNRWGRLVYHWSDPTKGWDGTINGKKASAGPYFYVIKAQGSDYNPNSEPDKNTKKRIGEFLLKGDINLLRGKE
jgi:gliding motility-associated-like protein